MTGMRAFISFAAVFALAAASFADGWLLKAPYEAKTKLVWNVTVNANVGGQDHEAKFKSVLTIDSKSDKEIKGKGAWLDLMVDGAEQGSDGAPTWDITFNPNGSIVSAGEGADYARMMAPASFIYPEKEVKVGDKWSAKYKPKNGKDISLDFEVVEQAKVGDADVLKVKSKMTEDGPMKSENLYWVGKDGKVLKFELDIKSWVVPLPGAPGDFDAKVKGELAK